MGGWIKIYRELLQWEWFDNAEMLQLFMYLLLQASTENRQWQGIELKRSQLVTSYARISRDLHLSEQKIRTGLKRLISTGEITHHSTNKYSVITICNYDKYQDAASVNSNQNNTQPDIQATIEQQSNNNQITTVEEYKEIKNIYRDSMSESREASFSCGSDEPQADRMPFEEIKKLWNITCTSFARLVVLSEARKNKIRNRIEEMGGVEQAMPIIQTVFLNMQASSFLKGDNERGWKASFDWIFENNKNWVKVFEGNYGDKNDFKGQIKHSNRKDNVNDLWK